MPKTLRFGCALDGKKNRPKPACSTEEKSQGAILGGLGPSHMHRAARRYRQPRLGG